MYRSSWSMRSLGVLATEPDEDPRDRDPEQHDCAASVPLESPNFVAGALERTSRTAIQPSSGGHNPSLEPLLWYEGTAGMRGPLGPSRGSNGP